MQKIYLGVDVGGTKTAVVLSARPPETLGRVEFATMPERGPQHALDHIVESANSLLAQQGLGHESIAAIVQMRSAEDRQRLEQSASVRETLDHLHGTANLVVRLYREAASYSA